MAVIAVDFDGCLHGGKYPEIGQANMGAIEELIARKAAGDKVILWTCRDGEQLEEAVRWCAEQGLTLDAVNDNLPEHVEQGGKFVRVPKDLLFAELNRTIQTVANNIGQSVVNNLVTNQTGFILDARQGKVLDDKIGELSKEIADQTKNLNNFTTDMNLAYKVVCRFSKTTLNTPYMQNNMYGQTGTVITLKPDNATWNTQIAIIDASYDVLIRWRNEGNWTSWSQVVTKNDSYIVLENENKNLKDLANELYAAGKRGRYTVDIRTMKIESPLPEQARWSSAELTITQYSMSITLFTYVNPSTIYHTYKHNPNTASETWQEWKKLSFA